MARRALSEMIGSPEERHVAVLDEVKRAVADLIGCPG
jgi:hypothetical protein